MYLREDSLQSLSFLDNIDYLKYLNIVLKYVKLLFYNKILQKHKK